MTAGRYARPARHAKPRPLRDIDALTETARRDIGLPKPVVGIRARRKEAA